MLGAAQMGDGEGARTFFEALNMGANPIFFEVLLKSQIWGLGIFCGLLSGGHEHFLACEIRGLVVFFNRKIPQNPAWVPRIFWTVPEKVLAPKYPKILEL